jgi:putative endonuclease
MPNNIIIGKLGEGIACEYLLSKGYAIINRNYRETWGEIDIICKDNRETLVFVEVKALKMFHNNLGRSGDCFTPEENLHQTKLNKVKRTAYLYANSHPELINDNRGWQIDLIAIEIDRSNLENVSAKEMIKYCQIRHYENI